MNQKTALVSLILLLLAFSILSCENRKEPASKPSDQELREDLLKHNRNLVLTEDERILAFIKRRGWEMSQSGTGLYYQIIGEEGVKAQKGDRVFVSYKIQLLNGDLAYESNEGEFEQFVVAQDAVESGLHEGIQLMSVGQKAKFIVPPHLGHGLTGDQNKIPSNASLVVFIKLEGIK
ncbi:FKBP-type peptidyl-prolyl cis-trans isomerase [Salibacteraceae bacterium]|nr:FKBP-type peptidyl-prolyl cis-trans isomerase [Salibacteraceae bacterium]